MNHRRISLVLLLAALTACSSEATEDSTSSDADLKKGGPASPAPSPSPSSAPQPGEARIAGDLPSILQRSLYLGTWAYQPGSAFVLACPSQPAQIVELSKAGPDGSPGTFVFSDNGTGIHEVDGLGCNYDFVLKDGAAVSAMVQTCNKFPDDKGGFVELMTDTSSKTTRDGRTMHVSAHAKVAGACDLYVEGYALRADAERPTLPALPAAVERERYLGTWAYEKSSALVLACPGRPAQVTDLATAANGQPGTFAFTALGADRVHEADGLGCGYDMTLVDGAVTIATTQTCNKLPDGKGGTMLLTTGPTRKASWDGKHMVVAARAKVGAAQDCDLFVSATAHKNP